MLPHTWVRYMHRNLTLGSVSVFLNIRHPSVTRYKPRNTRAICVNLVYKVITLRNDQIALEMHLEGWFFEVLFPKVVQLGPIWSFLTGGFWWRSSSWHPSVTRSKPRIFVDIGGFVVTITSSMKSKRWLVPMSEVIFFSILTLSDSLERRFNRLFCPKIVFNSPAKYHWVHRFSRHFCQPTQGYHLKLPCTRKVK